MLKINKKMEEWQSQAYCNVLEKHLGVKANIRSNRISSAKKMESLGGLWWLRLFAKQEPVKSGTVRVCSFPL